MEVVHSAERKYETGGHLASRFRWREGAEKGHGAAWDGISARLIKRRGTPRRYGLRYMQVILDARREKKPQRKAHMRGGGAVVSIRARGLLQGSGQAFAALGIASIRRSGCDAWVDVGIPRKDGVGGDSGGLPPNPRSMASAYGVFFDAAHRVAY